MISECERREGKLKLSRESTRVCASSASDTRVCFLDQTEEREEADQALEAGICMSRQADRQGGRGGRERQEHK